MSFLEKLPDIVKESKDQYERQKSGDFSPVEVFGTGENLLAMGDNLTFLSYLATKGKMKDRLQMIYSDPPFFSRSKYTATVTLEGEEGKNISSLKIPAYEDIWTHDMEEYLRMLAIRLWFMKDLLAHDGVIWLHLDWHAVHYVKLIMDEIFGGEHFLNEIIWQYKSGGSGKKHFSRKHDTILLYSKTKEYRLKVGKEKSYNRKGKPYRFKGVEEYRDEGGWYTLVNQKDVWQIDMVGRTSTERTGYATQKPLALLRRIVESSTAPGDICGDFFCGSGALAVAAEEAGRRWICCDREQLAIALTEKRMLNTNYSFLMEEQEGGGIPPCGKIREHPKEARDRIAEIKKCHPEKMILYRTEKRVVDILGNMIPSEQKDLRW